MENMERDQILYKIIPVRLTPSQIDLCNRLDEWHQRSSSVFSAKPSDMFKGSLFVISLPSQYNPDKIAQAAHSLREIFYPLWKKKKDSLKNYGAIERNEWMEEAGRIYGILSDLAHHHRPKQESQKFNNKDKFEKLIERFEYVMRHLLSRQFDIHREIDEFLG